MQTSLKQERKLWQQGYKLIAGVDEAGRGAWAGPIVAAAVALPRNYKTKPWHKLVNDSKKLSAKTRQNVFSLATQEVAWAVGLVTNQEIDKIGIAEANKQAVKRAVNNLPVKPEFILLDYIARFGDKVLGKPARAIIKGDANVFSIALASIIAKVTRDNLMVAYAKKYSGYGFAAHKGYGTRAHWLALQKLGPCPSHRLSYRPLKRVLL